MQPPDFWTRTRKCDHITRFIIHSWCSKSISFLLDTFPGNSYVKCPKACSKTFHPIEIIAMLCYWDPTRWKVRHLIVLLEINLSTNRHGLLMSARTSENVAVSIPHCTFNRTTSEPCIDHVDKLFQAFSSTVVLIVLIVVIIGIIIISLITLFSPKEMKKRNMKKAQERLYE